MAKMALRVARRRWHIRHRRQNPQDGGIIRRRAAAFSAGLAMTIPSSELISSCVVVLNIFRSLSDRIALIGERRGRDTRGRGQGHNPPLVRHPATEDVDTLRNKPAKGHILLDDADARGAILAAGHDCGKSRSLKSGQRLRDTLSGGGPSDIDIVIHATIRGLLHHDGVSHPMLRNRASLGRKHLDGAGLTCLGRALGRSEEANGNMVWHVDNGRHTVIKQDLGLVVEIVDTQELAGKVSHLYLLNRSERRGRRTHPQTTGHPKSKRAKRPKGTEPYP